MKNDKDWWKELKEGDEIICVESFKPYGKVELPAGTVLTAVRWDKHGLYCEEVVLLHSDTPFGDEYFSAQEMKYFDLHKKAEVVADASPDETEQPQATAEGLRYNEGKLAWHNVPMFLFEDVIRVGTYGAKKYDTFNYLKGMSLNGVLDCAKRHLCQFENPHESDDDAESGESHLAHAAWNLIFAAYIMKYRKQFDDRFKEEQ